MALELSEQLAFAKRPINDHADAAELVVIVER
jgi:hypothetical protein